MAAAAMGAASGAENPSDAAPEADWHGWSASRLIGAPEPPPPFTVERVFADLELRSPIHVAVEPGSGHLIIIQERKPLLRVRDDPAADEAGVFADLPADWLVYAITFDPDFATNRFVYFFLNGPTGHDPRGNRISRFAVTPEPEVRIDPATELTIIEWRSAGHDGGDLAFGPDGMLYLATGDGTGDSDGWVTGQTLDDLLGAVLRIDVRNAGPAEPYRIPQDNPFVGRPDARGEIWAYGLRNPWRMDIDQVSGQVWVGNNGQDLWETVHLVRPGENYGWSVFEGSAPFYPNRSLGPTPHVLPTIEHHHAEFRSLTGGVVHRGGRWPELEGMYLYGDYSTGRIWGALHDGERLVRHAELADTSLAIAGFRTVAGGEVLVVDHLGHAIHRLARNPPSPPGPPFPALLSETGIFRTLGHAPTPEEGVISYLVNAPGWNDGASAQRWMAVPEGARPVYSDSAPWTFPDGTALVQTLALDDGRPVETRVLLRQQGEWMGYAYVWNEEAADAALAPKEGGAVALPDGRTWQVPSRAECAVCHNRAANYVLGISGAQLNRPGSDGENQLRTFESLGLLDPLPGSLPDPIADPYEEERPLENRARAYLQVNCAMCHVEAGGGNSRMDLRMTVDRDRMGVLDARPQHATYGLENAMLVAPGAPDRSVLAHRVSRRGNGTGQMPPLGTSVIDVEGVALLREWIASMPENRPEIRAWRMDDFTAELGDPSTFEHGRDYLAGRDAWQRTGCGQCHRFAGEGGSVGPDLTGVGARLDDRSLLTEILEPSRHIVEGFAIAGIEPPLSTMPAGIVNVLTREEILDLVYFLKRDGRPRVAAVVTEYRHNSHADVIVGRLLQTETLDGAGRMPSLELASLFTDQLPPNDTSRVHAAAHGIPVFDSIPGALQLGGDTLSVDGVLLIAEHGDYPLSRTGSRVYPKRRFWEEIAAVFRSSERVVPVFIDKHLADNWEDARFIHDDASALGVPLMAGSSLPTTWRRPPVDVARGASLKEIVALTFHTTDAYGFHALEFVQALAEQRRGGESGVKAVRSLAGAEVWRALEDAALDQELFEAALARLTNPPTGSDLIRLVKDPRLFSIEYVDGLRVHLVELNGAVSEWSGAWRTVADSGESTVDGTLFWTQEGRPAMHFSWLLRGVEQMILTGRPSWNVERTLLTSGVLDAILISLHEEGRQLETPHLDVRYEPSWRWEEPPPPPPMRPWSGQ